MQSSLLQVGVREESDPLLVPRITVLLDVCGIVALNLDACEARHNREYSEHASMPYDALSENSPTSVSLSESCSPIPTRHAKQNKTYDWRGDSVKCFLPNDSKVYCSSINIAKETSSFIYYTFQSERDLGSRVYVLATARMDGAKRGNICLLSAIFVSQAASNK